MPTPGSSAAQLPGGVEAVAVRQVDVDDDDVGLEAHGGSDAAAQVAGLVDHLEVAVRSKAPRRPPRMRSWSSMSRTRIVKVVSLRA
jgi:hypothetical protein